jgi:hypothetical protein
VTMTRPPAVVTGGGSRDPGDRGGPRAAGLAGLAGLAGIPVRITPGAGRDGGRIVRALAWARSGDHTRPGLIAARFTAPRTGPAERTDPLERDSG